MYLLLLASYLSLFANGKWNSNYCKRI